MLARLLVSSATLTVPFGLLAILSGRAAGLVWLMIPFIALVPVFLVAALLLFIPVERMARAWGWPAVPALMVAGGVLGTVLAVLAAYLGRKRSVILSDIASGDAAVIASMAGLVALGAAMGAVWHFSRRVVEHFGAA